MSLCKSIDTLSMAYLDDELAAEERHELEAHLTECAACRGQLERERADLSMVRRMLAVPAAPDTMRARIAGVLDDEDRIAAKAQRRRWSQYLLPGSAVIAAAAAIVVFIGVQMPTERAATSSTVVHEAARQGTRTRSLPLEVQGPSTGPWLNQHFASVELPQIEESGANLIGARLLPGGINGHDAAALSYQLDLTGNPFVMTVLVVRDLRGDEMRDGTPIRVNNRTLYVVEDSQGRVVVSYIDDKRMGFMFIAPELSVSELIGLASRATVVAPR